MNTLSLLRSMMLTMRNALFASPSGLWTVAVLAWLVSSAWGQGPMDKPASPSIRVTGEASVTIKPDQAQIDIGVVTEAKNAQAAATENAERVEAVLGELRKALGPGADIKTTGYVLTPTYHYPKEGGTPTISGFSATNVIQVKLNDLTQVGKIIDTAAQSSANRIQGLQFTLKDEQAVYSQALREAVAKAKAKAEAIASALGLKIMRVLRVEEGGPGPRPVYAEGMRARTATPVQTPVEPGTVDVRATVTLTVEMAP
jgi:uncharacterized protein YggE